VTIIGDRLQFAIYFMRCLRGETLKAIGEAFEIESYSTVSSIVERVKLEIKKDRNLKRRIEKLKDLTVMSQSKTPLIISYSRDTGSSTRKKNVAFKVEQ